METGRETPIFILGAGGHGSEIVSYIGDLIARGEALRLVGAVDEGKAPGPWCGTEVLGDFARLKELLGAQPDVSFRYITAAGNNQLRRQFVRRVTTLGASNLTAWTLRHPQAVVGRDVTIGEGVCLAPGSILTTRVRLGHHCILNVNASVSHDCEIGDFVNINPGAVVCGNVKIGTGCYIGAGATIIDRVAIGAWTVVGAGAAVTGDLPAGVTAVGVPARVIKRVASPEGGQ
jgi:acetyltransferase EpsM